MKADLLLRKMVFAVAGNPMVRRSFEKYGMRCGVSRFVAGETLSESVEKVRRLNGQGLLATMDYLGESVSTTEQAKEAEIMIIRTLDTIRHERLYANVSVKLSQLGIAVDPDFCMESMCRILETARTGNNFVRIDMEDSTLTGRTIDTFNKLLERYGVRHVGIVIQSYLYRSWDDLSELGRLGANVRIVKGAYREPKEVAYPSKKDVDGQYVRLVKAHMERGCYTAAATHDETIIGIIKRFASERGIPPDRFEFQMLYGISGNLQHKLVREGYRVRVYTPFGKHWYPYFTRRIAERPANLLFVVKGMVRR